MYIINWTIPILCWEVLWFGLLVWRASFLVNIEVRISMLWFGELIFFFVVCIISFHCTSVVCTASSLVILLLGFFNLCKEVGVIAELVSLVSAGVIYANFRTIPLYLAGLNLKMVDTSCTSGLTKSAILISESLLVPGRQSQDLTCSISYQFNLVSPPTAKRPKMDSKVSDRFAVVATSKMQLDCHQGCWLCLIGYGKYRDTIVVAWGKKN